MIKQRRLTKIRVLEKTSFTFDDGRSDHTNTSSNTEKRRNMHSNVDNEGRNTEDRLNDEIQMPSSFEISRSLRSLSDDNRGESDIAECSVKCKGPTIITEILNQTPEEKWVVKFNNEGQPYRDESILLSSFTCTVGRNPELAPQGYSD
ncbi:hypothetical protein RND81_02G162900 [Saponaria officinalis]|uniref:Uncharacterized protein n=1 Tax=Saponaria officinalis TaxID=3572 RepID=A0AAW1MWG9_SAPOF